MDTKPQLPKPTLYRKAISGANWGMLAGFWVELPLMAAFLFKPFKPTNLAGWAKVSEWSVKWVLPSTVAGVVYGYSKPGREFAKLQAVKDAQPAVGAAEPTPKSWVATEQARDDADSHLRL